MDITDSKQVATWVDLFDGPNELLTSERGDTTVLRGTVHRWTRRVPGPGQVPVGTEGVTKVSGFINNPGLNELQPLSLNSFASFGGQEQKFDAGLLKFTVGDIAGELPGSIVPRIEYGIHFNTHPGPLDLLGNTQLELNTGYTLLIDTEDNKARLFRVGLDSTGVFTKTALADVFGGSEFDVAAGDILEVRWGDPRITGEAFNIVVLRTDAFGTASTEVRYNFGAQDTEVHKNGGYVGVGRWEGSGPIDFNFLSRFEFRNILQPLSAYFDETRREAISYRGIPGGLYVAPSLISGVDEFSNEPPPDWAKQATDMAALSAAGAALHRLQTGATREAIRGLEARWKRRSRARAKIPPGRACSETVESRLRNEDR